VLYQREALHLNGYEYEKFYKESYMTLSWMGKKSMRVKRESIKLLLVIALAAALVLFANELGGLALAGPVDPNVYAPGTGPFNSTYGEWSAKWWQWVLSIPFDSSPMSDETGQNCSIGQQGPVWFLAGTSGGSAERSCTIPSNTAIFFPILALECSKGEFPTYTDEDLIACTRSGFERIINMDLTVDGVPISDLYRYETESPPFMVTFPENNVYGVPPGETEARAYGYYVLLKPLSEGAHEIEFDSAFVDYTEFGTENYATHVKYNLTIG
jgi:hypothetical protein